MLIDVTFVLHIGQLLKLKKFFNKKYKVSKY